MRHDILTTSTLRVTQCVAAGLHTLLVTGAEGRCRSNVAPRAHMNCQSRFIARYHCRSRNKTVQETESRFRSAGYYGTEFRSRRVTTEDKQVQQPPFASYGMRQCCLAAISYKLSYIYPPGGNISTAWELLVYILISDASDMRLRGTVKSVISALQHC